MIDVARLRCSRAHSVVLTFWNIRACAEATGNVARLAGRGARIIATITVDAKGAHAFGAGRTGPSKRFLAVPITVTSIVATDHTRGVDGRRRIGGRAHRAALILRTLIPIHWHVARQNRRLDVPIAIAFEDFAVARRLSCRQIRTIGGVRKTALIVVTRTGFAEIVHSGALARRRTSNALPHAVADLGTSAREAHCFQRIRWRPVRTNILRAEIAVVGYILVIWQDGRPHVAIADDFLAIVRCLQDGTRQRPRSLISNFALVVDATAFFTLGLDDVHAMARRRAFDACAIAITNLWIAGRARYSFWIVRIRRRALSTSIGRARIVVVQHVGIIVERYAHSVGTILDLAIPDHLVESGCRHTVEIRVHTLARRIIAQIIGTRIRVVAIGIRHASNFAHACIACTGLHPLHTRHAIGQLVIDGFSCQTRIRGA